MDKQAGKIYAVFLVEFLRLCFDIYSDIMIYQFLYAAFETDSVLIKEICTIFECRI